MKLYESYKNLLVEGQIQACVAQFGQELFADQLGGSEPNTDVEDDYASLIHDFTRTSHGSNINSEFINMARKLKTCVSSYPEILYPNGKAYRGTKITLNHLLQMFDGIKNNLRTGQSFEINYKAKSPIQSWSDNEDIVLDEFSNSGPMLLLLLDKFEKSKQNGTTKEFIDHVIQHKLDTKVPVIISYAATPDSFIFKGKYFSHLSRYSEDEILRIDDRPIRVNAKIYPRQFSANIFDFLEAIRNN